MEPMLTLHGFPMSPNTRRALFGLEELARFPTVAEWMKRIASRPAWQKVQA